MNKTPFVSLYANVKAKENRDIDINGYISFIKSGYNQDLVLKARAIRQKEGNSDNYKEIKYLSPLVTGSCTFISGAKKEAKNISSLNGLIIIDIDNDQVTDEIANQLQNDPYTYIMHKSFGGGYNYCVFVRIDSNRFEDSFENLAQYYYSTYSISIDQACKNKNRLRFLSYDPDIFINDSAKRWKASKPKTKEIKSELTDYIFFEDDFNDLISQIQAKSIDLVKGEYSRYVNIGFALFDKFGVNGEQYFKVINEFNPNQNKKRAHLEWKGLCKSGSVGIGTFYYYCKEAGLDIYSDKTKTIINAVTVSKSQCNPTIASVSKNVITQGYSIEESDKEVIQQLIDSKVDYSKLANSELKEIEVLENFILQRYEPKYNEINQNLYVNGDTIVNDSVMASIVITCMKNLDLKKAMTKDNVKLIMGSSDIPSWNPILDFFTENYSEDCEKGLIEKYAKTIQPYNEYNFWALKKWLVGAVHNWTCDSDNTIVCPHTLVLTGAKHGIGKTSFMRNILPKELRKYFKEDRIDIKKPDSLFRMGTSLMILDDEFGGKSVKEAKDFKNVTDKHEITLRRPYQQFDITVKRRVILAGTTNEIDIISDFDNRRILPINFQGVDFETMEKIDKTALLCEAYYELLHGYDWKIIGNEKDYLASQTKNNITIMPFEEIFKSDFSFVEEKGLMPIIVQQGDIRRYYSDTIRPSNAEIKSVFIKNKQENKSRSIDGRSKTGYKVWVKASNKLFSEWYSGFNEDSPF